MNLLNLKSINKDSQERLAKIVGVSQKTISNYLNGTTEPSLKELCKLADYYNVTLDYLVGRETNNNYITAEQKELLNDFKQLTPINQIKIIAEIKGILIGQN